MRWLYKGNVTTLCRTQEQLDELEEYFPDKRTAGKLTTIHVNEALKMVRSAKEKASQSVESKTDLPTAEEVSKWTRQKCDSYLKKNDKEIPEAKGVNVGREAVLKALTEE
jgi:hypothetical protein